MLFLPILALVVQQPTVDLSTPEKALASFVDAYNRRDTKSLISCVLGGKSSPMLDRYLAVPNGVTIRYRVASVRKSALSRDSVRLEYLLTLIAGRESTKPVLDRLDFRWTEDGWKAIAVDIKNAPRPVGVLDFLIISAATPEIMDLDSPVNASTKAKSNMKEILWIAYGVNSSQRGVLNTLNTENYVRLMSLKGGKSSIFTSPLDHEGVVSVLINPNFYGVNFSMLRNASKTIWFYEGKLGALKFRYDGKAIVGMCDGTVLQVSPEEARSLLWK